MRYWLLALLLLAGCQQPSPPPSGDSRPTDSAHAEQSSSAPATKTPAAETPSTWQLKTTTNPADGSTTVVLHREAVEVRNRSDAGAPILYVRCKSSTTELYIDWHDYIPGASHQVTTRLDRGPTQARQWALSRSNIATFYPDSPIDFLQALMQSKLLYAEATPYNAAPVTAVFNLEGLTDAIQPLRTACDW